MSGSCAPWINNIFICSFYIKMLADSFNAFLFGIAFTDNVNKIWMPASCFTFFDLGNEILFLIFVYKSCPNKVSPES